MHTYDVCLCSEAIPIINSISSECRMYVTEIVYLSNVPYRLELYKRIKKKPKRRLLIGVIHNEDSYFIEDVLDIVFLNFLFVTENLECSLRLICTGHYVAGRLF